MSHRDSGGALRVCPAEKVPGQRCRKPDCVLYHPNTPCKYFAQQRGGGGGGGCRDGNRCRFAHDDGDDGGSSVQGLLPRQPPAAAQAPWIPSPGQHAGVPRGAEAHERAGRDTCPNESPSATARCNVRGCPHYHPYTPCKYHMDGHCRDGARCRYAHNGREGVSSQPEHRAGRKEPHSAAVVAVPERDVCRTEKRDGSGCLHRGGGCPYYHPNTPCKYYSQGFCRSGAQCNYSHAPQDQLPARRPHQVYDALEPALAATVPHPEPRQTPQRPSSAAPRTAAAVTSDGDIPVPSAPSIDDSVVDTSDNDEAQTSTSSDDEGDEAADGGAESCPTCGMNLDEQQQLNHACRMDAAPQEDKVECPHCGKMETVAHVTTCTDLRSNVGATGEGHAEEATQSADATRDNRAPASDGGSTGNEPQRCQLAAPTAVANPVATADTPPSSPPAQRTSSHSRLQAAANSVRSLSQCAGVTTREINEFYQRLPHHVGAAVSSNPTTWAPPVDSVALRRWFAFFTASGDSVALHALRVAVMQQTHHMCWFLANAAPSSDDPFHDQHPLHPLRRTQFIQLEAMRKHIRELNPPRRFPRIDTVEVMPCDCVEIALVLREQGLNPLMLNMASATSPGGGFLVGDGAQEENLHRRSNYYQSTNPQLLRDAQNVKSYPIPEEGGIYSPAITFFRGQEAEGYPLMSEPVSIACIAVAAVRHPPLQCNERQPMESRFLHAADRDIMRKKVELVFAAGVAAGHHSLVLGAFGCGAFRCPASEVAALIVEVASGGEYSGYFRRVVVAVLEDHNSINIANVDGLLKVFANTTGCSLRYPVEPPPFDTPCAYGGLCDVFQCPLRHPPESCKDGVACVNTNPHHLRNYRHAPLCPMRGLCTQVSHAAHSAHYRHPPQCRHGACCVAAYESTGGLRHRIELRHPPFCQDGGKCPCIFDVSPNAVVHMQTFLHPPACRNGGRCQEYFTSAEHGAKYMHPSLCAKGKDCEHIFSSDRSSKDHCFRHLHPPKCADGDACTRGKRCQLAHPPLCPRRGLCPRAEDVNHQQNFSHPQRCQFFDKPRDSCHDLQHLLDYTHHRQPCKHQYNCEKIQDPKHCVDFTHGVTSFPCPEGATCARGDDAAHMARFAHPCWYHQLCRNRNDDVHRTLYYHRVLEECRQGAKCKQLDQLSHRQQFAHPCPMVACRFGAFCTDWARKHRTKFTHPPAVNGDGCDIAGLTTAIDFHANLSFMRERLRDGPGKGHDVQVEDQILRDVKSYHPCHRCKPETFLGILNHGHLISKSFQDGLQGNPERALEAELRSLPLLMKELNRNKVGLDTVWPFILAIAERNKGERDRSKAALQKRGVSAQLISRIEEITKNLRNTHEGHKFSGIGYAKDMDAGTDKHVFSIVGPHTGHYYGNILLVLDRKVMHHPDFYLTCAAVTSYLSNGVSTLFPWLTKPGESGASLLPRCKLHPAVHGWDLVVGGYYQCAAQAQGKSFRDLWIRSDSHSCIEGHLPQTVPLAMVEKIIMPKDEWQALPDDAKNICEALWGSNPARDDDFEAKIILVDDKTHVESTARRFACANTAHLRGFSLVLPQTKRRHRLLPIHIRKKEKGFVAEFVVTGGPWSFTFGAPNDKRTYVEHGYTIVVNGCDEQTERRCVMILDSRRKELQRGRAMALQPMNQDVRVLIVVAVSSTETTISFSEGERKNVVLAAHLEKSLFQRFLQFFGSDEYWTFAISTDRSAVRFNSIVVQPL